MLTLRLVDVAFAPKRRCFQVPGSIFNWSDTASGSSILMMLHPRGYGVAFDDETGEQLGHENPCPMATDMVPLVWA